VLGHHEGIHRFTVGHGRGLNVASRAPLYVQRIDPASKAVVVGPSAEATRVEFPLRRARWVAGEVPLGRDLTVKIRHRHAGARGRSSRETGRAQGRARWPERAVTPGQAAVLYDGDECWAEDG